MFWAAEHFRQSAPIYFEERVAAKLTDQASDESRIAEADPRLERFGAILDSHLKGREFVVGNQPTFADIELAAPLSQMSRSKIPYKKLTNIMRWSEGLATALPT